MKFKVYTDGACSGNPEKDGPIILDNDSIKLASENENNTTNNRMEIDGSNNTLKKIKKI